MAILFAPPRFKATDKDNAPISGAFLQFLQYLTSTLQPIYTDSTLQIPLLNPLKADANGLFPEIWLDDSLPPYKVIFSSPDTNNSSIPGSTIWSIQQYNSILSAENLLPLINPITEAEVAAGVTPTNYAYVPGDIRRYGNADPTGVSDSTAAIDAVNLLAGTMTIFGGGAQCSYRTSHSLLLKNFMDFDGQGCTLHFFNNPSAVPAVTNATGAGVLYPRIRNVTLRADTVNTLAAMDLVDVNRGSFSRIQIDRGIASMSWGYGIRLRTSASLCLWNRFFDIEVDTVTVAAISIENSNCNQNAFYSFKLINDVAILLPFGVKITSGGDNHFFDLDLEASFSTNGAGNAYGVNFNTGSENRIFGLRTEGYSNSASFYGVNYAGTAGDNWVLGHYFTGFGAVSAFNGLIAGNTYVGEGYNYPPSGSLTGLKGEIGWDSVADRFKATTNGGGQRLVVQSPALDAINMNGNQITGVQANSSGWGTPTGATVVSNFSGSAATLVQCSNSIAAIINALKSLGIFGA